MVLIGIQIVGLIFGLVMIYFSFINFKRKEFSPRDFIIWGTIWVIFMIAIIFPQKLNIFLETLKITSALWLFTILGFLFLFAMVFYLHAISRRNQRKIESLVKKIALEEAKKD